MDSTQHIDAEQVKQPEPSGGKGKRQKRQVPGRDPALSALIESQGLTKTLADAIKQGDHFARDGGGRLYRFSEGVYRPDADRHIKASVKAFLLEWLFSRDWTPRASEAVVEFIGVDAPTLWERPPLDVINVKNGLLRWRDRVLLPHSPSHLSPIQLNVIWDPSATCPAIIKFVNESFPPDAVDLAWEIPAWLSRPDTTIQKAILLLGPGGGGKSVYLRMVTAFLGKQNTSGVSLHKIESDRFAASRLIGKLANICADLPSAHLSGTSVFKTLTGGDVLTAERKFADSFDFTPYARLVFSANFAPRSEDSSQGFFDRWVVIPFDRMFRGTEAEIPGGVLDAMLQAPGELSGLLNKALDAMSRLDGKCAFTMPSSVQAALREFRATTDPLAVWLDRHTVDDPSAFVAKKLLRVAYNAHLEQHGKPAMTETAFGLAFGKHRPNVETKRKLVGGRQEHVYVGIGLVADSGNCDREESPESPESPDIQEDPSQGCHSCHPLPTCYLPIARAPGDVLKVEQDKGNYGNYGNPGNDSNGEGAESPEHRESCNHINPLKWVHRDGKAFCPGCDKFMGRVSEPSIF